MHHFTLALFADIGGSEIMLCGVIALLLFGKELPVVMRNMGKYYAQFKNTLDSAKGEFTREMEVAAREIEIAKKEVGLKDVLNEKLTLDDDHPVAPHPSPELTVNPPYTPPTQPLESIDRGPESLDKLSAAPPVPAHAPAPASSVAEVTVPAPAKIPAPVDLSAPDVVVSAPLPAIEEPKPAVAAVPHAEETRPDSLPTTLEELEKRIAPPKKIPSPIA